MEKNHHRANTSLEDAQELHVADFTKIATGFEGYIFPPTLNRGAIATLLVDSTPGGMMRAVVTCPLATGVLPKAPTTPPDWEKEGSSCETFDNIRNTDGGINGTPMQKQLQNPTTESNLAPIIAPVVTRKGKQRMLQSYHPPTPRESRQLPPTAPLGDIHLLQHLWPRLHELERGNRRTRAHQTLCSPPKRPPRRRQRQLLVRANIETHPQPWYNGSQACSPNRRNLGSGRGKTPTCWERYKTWATEEPGGNM